MEKVDYDARLHAVYAAGRRMSPDAHKPGWRRSLATCRETRPLVWLDLGSGTGRRPPRWRLPSAAPPTESSRQTRCVLKPLPALAIPPSGMRLGLPSTSRCQMPRVTPPCCSSSGTT